MGNQGIVAYRTETIKRPNEMPLRADERWSRSAREWDIDDAVRSYYNAKNRDRPEEVGRMAD